MRGRVPEVQKEVSYGAKPHVGSEKQQGEREVGFFIFIFWFFWNKVSGWP